MVTAGFAALQCCPCLPHPPPLGRAPYLRGARGLALLPRESHVEDSCRGCGTYRGSVLHGGSEPVKDVEPQPSTQAARAARAVLILTEDDMFQLHGGEALEETAYEDKCPTGSTCLLFCPFLPSLWSAFCLSSDFLAFSL
ncbi:uncharacterized protein LOC121071928 isoform X1 [Cygnus olor]|uniref:uncharacterized protein LOC121071928 isoform X1 n=1 Tax=Cygnus olor TaxID=8869 RepID=UPI001ADEA2A2|nr:uncharacterized protein LOC121071928 isoform X1 [Cygnus olor]